MSNAEAGTTSTATEPNSLERLGQELEERLGLVMNELEQLDRDRVQPLREEERRLRAAVAALQR